MKEIVILSGKGGSGKTSVSVAFATIHQNSIVADCDVDAANMHIILQPKNYYEGTMTTGKKAVIMQDKCINCGVCMEFCSFNAISVKNGTFTISEAACDGCQLCWRLCGMGAIELVPSNKSKWYIGDYRNGKLIHARLQPGEENSGKLVGIVRNLAKSLANEIGIENIIIDGPPGTACPAISSVTGANKALIITEPTHSGFHDMKRILTLVSSFNVKSYILINKYDLNIEVSNEIENWCNKNGFSVIGKIKFDKNIVDAMLNCKSIVEHQPESDTSKELIRIYNNLLEN